MVHLVFCFSVPNNAPVLAYRIVYRKQALHGKQKKIANFNFSIKMLQILSASPSGAGVTSPL
jgi:hypothetical protein